MNHLPDGCTQADCEASLPSETECDWCGECIDNDGGCDCPEDCPECDGHGEWLCQSCDGSGEGAFGETRCLSCNGGGVERKCEACGGEGDHESYRENNR